MPAASEVPGVNSAIQHLQELGERMRTSEFSFKETDLEAIDDVSEAIKELEAERLRVHTLLETETINASVLRHRLQFLPAWIQKEIAEAVESARHSNTEELKTLNEKLKSLNEEIEFLEAKKKSLIKENAILHPERDLVRSQHEEVISQLNQRMADKASKQITLNETRDTLRDTNQKIVELETQILILKEDMIQERADARQEKKRLKQAVHDTTKKTKKQKEANISKKKELDKLHEKLVQSEHELSEIRKSIRRFETSKARFDTQEQSFQAQLDKETKENKILKDKGYDLGQGLLKMERKNILKEEEMKTNLKDLETQIGNSNVEYDELIDVWSKSKKEMDEASGVREVDGSKVGELDKVLQGKKRDLSRKAGETARMKQENDEMEYRMKQLEENHQVTVQLLEKAISDYRDALTKERKERFELQEKRDILTREIDDFKMAFGRYMNELNRRINKAKQDQIDLTNEGAQLKVNIRTDDVKIKTLKDDLKQTQKKFDKMKTGLDTHIAGLQENIGTLEKVVDGKQNEIDDKTPDYEALEKLYLEKLEEYERTKKEIVQLKNKKTGLLDQTALTKKEIVKLTNPTVLMQQELRSKRKKALGKMREQTKELTEIEEKIYHAGRKLRSVIEENEKFKLGIDRMQEESETLKRQKTLNARLQEALRNELLVQRGKLQSGWVEDRKMQNVYADRDRLVLEDITEMRNRTEEREAKVADITEKLDGELVLLTAFLENVSHRRPHEQGTGSRPSTTASSLRPPTILQDYLESRTMLNTQESRAEAISRVRSKMFEKKEDEEGLIEESLEGEDEEKESFADTVESELRWADPIDDAAPVAEGITS